MRDQPKFVPLKEADNGHVANGFTKAHSRGHRKLSGRHDSSIPYEQDPLDDDVVTWDEVAVDTREPTIQQHAMVDSEDGSDDVGYTVKQKDLRCGYWFCKPKWLQKFNNSKALLACVCYFVFVQGFVVSGVNNVNTATLERRFDLSSVKVAWITSAEDVVAGTFSIVAGYIATFANKTRMMTWMAMIMAVGCVVMMIPHFVTGPYVLGNKVMDVCDAAGNSTMSCGPDDGNSRLSHFIYVFIVGMGLIGVGGAAAFTIGTPLLDENIDTKNTPLYIGIMHSFAALGPALGYTAGGFFLNIYVDTGKVNMTEIDISPQDPRFVGAWWIGFAAATVASVSVVLFNALFPEELPEARAHRLTRRSEAHAGVGETETARSDFGRHSRDIFTSFKLVFSNPVWVFMTAGATFEAGLVVSIATFLPKILQFQYSMSPSKGALFSGAIVVPAAALGHVIGGIIPKCIKSKVKGLVLQCAICSILGGCAAFGWLLHCQMADIAGVTVPYSDHNTTDAMSLTSPCNANCSCSSRSYEPVCGADGIQYFSACHAGCVRSARDFEGQQFYYQCSCIEGLMNVSSSHQWSSRDGICTSSCNKFFIFLPAFFTMIIATFIANTSFHSITMRCVPDKQRAFAYGLQGALIRFLGATPSPIIIGLMLDSVCMIWQETCNGLPGACWIYNNSRLAYRLLLCTLLVKIASGICFFLAYFLYKPPPDGAQVHIIPDSSLEGAVANIRHESTDMIEEAEHLMAEIDISETKEL